MAQYYCLITSVAFHQSIFTNMGVSSVNIWWYLWWHSHTSYSRMKLLENSTPEATISRANWEARMPENHDCSRQATIYGFLTYEVTIKCKPCIYTHQSKVLTFFLFHSVCMHVNNIHVFVVDRACLLVASHGPRGEYTIVSVPVCHKMLFIYWQHASQETSNWRYTWENRNPERVWDIGESHISAA